jgi:hypothetical protein
MNTEPAGCHLCNGVRAVRIEVPMKAPFTRVVEDAQFLCRSGKRKTGVETDGAIGHGREHDGNLKSKLQRKEGFRMKPPSSLHSFGMLKDKFHAVGLASNEGQEFHRLAKGVNGRVGNLARVEEEVIPVNLIRPIAAHGRKEDSPGFGLLPDVAKRSFSPVFIGA